MTANVICQLPPHVANQIAAGEVVERPSSVIKELLENAIDAKATSLHIDIEKGGLGLSRVRDNGMGIAKEQLHLALMPHATSKIQTVDDLMDLHSLGFRGEALASISSVSRFSITSKPQDQDSAAQITVADEGISCVQPAAHPTGTTIEVRDLFYNVPVRRTFLKSEKVEFSHLEAVVKKIALSHFEVAIHLAHNGRTQFSLPIANTEAEIERRISRLLGKSFVGASIHFQEQHDEYKVKGWLGLPEFLRSQNDLQYLFLNGRMVRDKVLLQAVRKVYEPYLYPGRCACFLLYFSIPVSEVDVNVHPTKHEVRFKRSRSVHDFIISALSHALNNGAKDQETEIIEAPIEQQYETVVLDPACESAKSTEETVANDFQLSNIHGSQLVALNSRHGLLIHQGMSILFDVAKTYQQQLIMRITKQMLNGGSLQARPVLVPLMVPLSGFEVEKLSLLRFQPYGFELSLLSSEVLSVRSFPVITPHLNIIACVTAMLRATDKEEIEQCIAKHQQLALPMLNEAETASLMRFLIEQTQKQQASSAFTLISENQWQELLNENA